MRPGAAAPGRDSHEKLGNDSDARESLRRSAAREIFRGSAGQGGARIRCVASGMMAATWNDLANPAGRNRVGPPDAEGPPFAKGDIGIKEELVQELVGRKRCVGNARLANSYSNRGAVCTRRTKRGAAGGRRLSRTPYGLLKPLAERTGPSRKIKTAPGPPTYRNLGRPVDPFEQPDQAAAAVRSGPASVPRN